MSFAFVNISSTKFSLNAIEFFKTFQALAIGTDFIKVVNVYDSSNVLLSKTNISQITVDGNFYANSTLLINALQSIIFAKEGAGTLDSTQVEANRIAIVNLQNNQIHPNHNHNNSYYTKQQVDQKISEVNTSSTTPTQGELDGDNLVLKDSQNNNLFSVDVKTLKRQGTVIIYNNGQLILKNDKGETLSTTATDFLDLITTEIDNLRQEILGAAPETLNALNELATALGNDPNFATTVSTALGNRLRIDIANQNLTNQQKTNVLTNLGINNHEIKVAQGVYVDTEGNPDRLTPIVGNPFRGWNGDTYYVGKIDVIPFDIADENTFTWVVKNKKI